MATVFVTKHVTDKWGTALESTERRVAQNLLNFGSETAKNLKSRTFIFTRPSKCMQHGAFCQPAPVERKSTKLSNGQMV